MRFSASRTAPERFPSACHQSAVVGTPSRSGGWRAAARIVAGALAVLAVSAVNAMAGNIFVANGNTIGEYTESGAVVNASLITGLNGPSAIAIDGSDLYVMNQGSGTIGKYTTSGATVNASFITGLSNPQNGLMVVGNNLYVSNTYANKVAVYTTAGSLVNSSFISVGLPGGMAISGSTLYIQECCSSNHVETFDATTGASINSALISGLSYNLNLAVSASDLFVQRQGVIGEYTLAGAPVNTSLISTGCSITGLAIDGSNLFVTNPCTQVISEYTTSGTLVNASLITGVSSGVGAIAISASDSTPAPEPASIAVLAAGLLTLGSTRRLLGRRG